MCIYSCVWVCAHACGYPSEDRRGNFISQNLSYRQLWAIWSGSWEPNLGPWQDQQVRLTNGPSLLSPKYRFLVGQPDRWQVHKYLENSHFQRRKLFLSPKVREKTSFQFALRVNPKSNQSMQPIVLYHGNGLEIRPMGFQHMERLRSSREKQILNI